MIEGRLLRLLACPDCKGPIRPGEGCLVCGDCGREYCVRNGIPLLWGSSTNLKHLWEEESLAEIMKREPSSAKEGLSRAQWQESKQEFWSVVQGRLGPPPKEIVNIGCGFDTSFQSFERDGYFFVNFDIVDGTLQTLKDEHGAKSCVAGDLLALPFRSGSFDYVVAIDTIHHECDRLQTILA